jgi:hypothetical protein
MHIVKKGNKNMKSIAYKSLVHPILEDGAVCWAPYRECQINALDHVQNKAAKFAYHTGGLGWESLAQRRKIARMCALFKMYTGERAWKAIGDRLQAPSCLSRVDHNWKIRARKQRTNVEKYSFVNRSITDWNQLPEGVIGALTGNMYVACSKSIGRDFFLQKLMKHGRCAVVGWWRGPSCAYVDFFPPADSVILVHPVCE